MSRQAGRWSYLLAGPAAVDHYAWDRQTYTLEAARFRLLEDAAGRYHRREGQLELSNDLVCEPPNGPPSTSPGDARKDSPDPRF